MKLNSAADGSCDEDNGEYRMGVCRRLARSLPENILASYFKFGFVRNPYARLVSAWAFLGSKKGYFPKTIDFTTFVHAATQNNLESLNDSPPRHEYSIYVDIEWHVMPMRSHLYDASGNLLVDFVGRVENFENDIARIFRRLKISDSNRQEIPSKNTTGHASYDRYYTKDLKRLVYEYLREDFETFGYESEL